MESPCRKEKRGKVVLIPIGITRVRMKERGSSCTLQEGKFSNSRPTTIPFRKEVRVTGSWYDKKREKYRACRLHLMGECCHAQRMSLQGTVGKERIVIAGRILRRSVRLCEKRNKVLKTGRRVWGTGEVSTPKRMCIQEDSEDGAGYLPGFATSRGQHTQVL